MMRPQRDQRLTLDQTKRISAARVLGQGKMIYLEDSELLRLISIIVSDMGYVNTISGIPVLPSFAEGDYYKIPLDWFLEGKEKVDLIQIYLECVGKILDFETYFENLCELHKRRRKYQMILSAQPIPTMLQISPRALLEFGGIPTPALASLLTWRKWFYDIDNRAAQETGYLFEPILASSLGGIPYGARNSPIKRESDNSKGRQVDCIVGRYAYEFKLRVTIAASGQGRFGEELDFARDCYTSDFTPILLVLDPTPSSRLSELTTAFESYGGRAYIGNDAWEHIDAQAGKTMATFIERYIRKPITSLDAYSERLLDFYISIDRNRSGISFQIGSEDQNYKWLIKRATDELLADEEN